jgi:hypothetical protein
MEVSLAMGRKAVAAAALVVVVVLALLVWIAGEAHYRNCLTEADLRYPAAPLQTAAAESDAGTLAAVDERPRNEALSECSRWP